MGLTGSGYYPRKYSLPIYFVFKEIHPTFGACLLLAALIHAALLAYVRLTYPLPTMLPRPELSVFLAPRLEPETMAARERRFLEPHSIQPQINKIVRPTETVFQPDTKPPEYLPQTVEARAVTDEEKAMAQPVVGMDKPRVKVYEMMDRASQVAREEGRLLEKLHPPPGNKITGSHSTLAAAIGKAFEAGPPLGPPKVTSFADGMVEVVTAYGTRYCYIPPKDVAKGGLVDSESIPMTCP